LRRSAINKINHIARPAPAPPINKDIARARKGHPQIRIFLQDFEHFSDWRRPAGRSGTPNFRTPGSAAALRRVRSVSAKCAGELLRGALGLRETRA
jgi:hypothetical protein